eukprot:5390974-Heterocapsa_arctica.AAC.1
MVFIPKNSEGIASSVEAQAAELRPVTQSNSDQKLLNLALNFSLVQMCKQVYVAQRGFIEGRILTDNVLELDSMTECHLIKDDLCVGQVYFDIMAVFPSAAWK